MIASVAVFVVKPLLVLVFLLVAFRLLGKRASAQMNVYDLAMIIALGNAVQNAMTAGRGELWVGLAASATLILAAAAYTKISGRSTTAQRFFAGSPTVVLSNGRILRSRLRRELLTENDLMAALRAHGLRGPGDVQLAILEVDGSLSIVPKRN